MKLIYCPNCGGFVTIRLHRKVACDCGTSWGRYLDSHNAEFGGAAIPCGIDYEALRRALRRSSKTNGKQSEPFIAFVIEADCPTFKKTTS